MLLLGALPMVSAPGVFLRVNAYQLPFGSLLLFLLLPITLMVIWGLNRWHREFARFSVYVLTGAAVLQIFTLSMLLRVAGDTLEESLIAMQFDPNTVSQNVGVGIILLLGVSALLFVACGLQLINSKAKHKKSEPEEDIEWIDSYLGQKGLVLQPEPVHVQPAPGNGFGWQ